MLSVIVIAKNEEKMLGVCLESVKWVDEIVVADNGSTDKTLEVARKYTDRIIKFEGEDFATLRNKAFEESKGDWVLYVDADERILKPLREEIEGLVKSSEKSAFAVSRTNVIFGERVSYGPYKNDWVIRLFKREDFETWVGKVHEYGKFKGELGYTKNSLLHLTHRNLDHFISKSLEWSKIDAKLRIDAGHPKMTKWRFFRIFWIAVFDELIKRKGLFGGTVGMMDSLLQAFSFYMTYVRLWEMQQSKPLNERYKDIDEKLLKDGFEY